MIALVDYGTGNLASVRKALAACGAEWHTPLSPAGLETASGVVIPGVGHFSSTRALGEGWRQAVRNCVSARVPVLGICLGMQWLFDRSDEAPDTPGLGVLAGSVTQMHAAPDVGHPFRGAGANTVIKIPHVGWNALSIVRASRILDGVDDGAQVYFTHSFAAPVTADTIATCEHGVVFAAAIERGRTFGVQFHPEKSGDAGLRILGNFVTCCRND